MRETAVETITHDGRTLCILVYAAPLPDATTFYTPNDFNLQIGKIVYAANTEIPRHSHRPVTRTVTGTSEVIFVQKGRTVLDVYDDNQSLIASREMTVGDVVALVSGGHGFRQVEDTVLIEVKQGPYSGVQEKDPVLIMIPVNEPLFAGNEQAYVNDCMATGWVSSSGRYIARFEQDWAAYCGMKHGIAVSNGTTALQVAVDALRLGPGDEVILPSFTIISCALAVVRAGATPVVVDCDPQTYCMDLDQVAAAITSRTKAIMPVHMYGHPVDMDQIIALAERHGLAVIEDAAQAHGCEYASRRDGNNGWRRCGGLGTLSTFSFFANKLVTTGEGGMVLTNDDELAERCRSLRNLCFKPTRFLHDELGYNYRFTNLQAAIGVAQVERMDDILARKRAMGRCYDEKLAGIKGLHLPAQKDWARINYWMYAILLDDAVDMDAFQFAAALKQKGVETRPFFLGMHEQPVFHKMGLFKDLKLPVSQRIYRKGLYLPSGVAITPEQIDAVVDAVKEVLT